MPIGFAFARRPAIALVIILLAYLPGMTVDADEADASKAEQHFDVMEYRVIGNTVLTNRDIERVLYPITASAPSSSISRRRRWRAAWCACG